MLLRFLILQLLYGRTYRIQDNCSHFYVCNADEFL